jgi:hypothetical protein
VGLDSGSIFGAERVPQQGLGLTMHPGAFIIERHDPLAVSRNPVELAELTYDQRSRWPERWACQRRIYPVASPFVGRLPCDAIRRPALEPTGERSWPTAASVLSAALEKDEECRDAVPDATRGFKPPRVPPRPKSSR